jgi:hypothetical protein
MQNKSLPARVWETLSPINVNNMTEKKGNLTYLSWASAIEILGSHYPDHDFDTSFEKVDDETMMVYSKLTIRDGEESYTRHMWLPVMDHRNNAIKNPDARKISDASMRCLAKNISVSTGLGLYIYRGEDLPSAEVEAKSNPITTEQFELLMEGLVHSGIDVAKFTNYYSEHHGVKKLNDLPAGLYDHAMGAINNRIAQNAATEQQ